MENSINKITMKVLGQMYDAKDKYLWDVIMQDVKDNPDKWKGTEVIGINRDKIKELVRIGAGKVDQAEQERQKQETRIPNPMRLGFFTVAELEDAYNELSRRLNEIYQAVSGRRGL